jgi:hypothetical protein
LSSERSYHKYYKERGEPESFKQCIKTLCGLANSHADECKEGSSLAVPGVHALLCLFAKTIYDLRLQHAQGSSLEIYQDRRIAIVDPKFYIQCMDKQKESEQKGIVKGFLKFMTCTSTPRHSMKTMRSYDYLYGYKDHFNILILPMLLNSGAEQPRWVSITRDLLCFYLRIIGDWHSHTRSDGSLALPLFRSTIPIDRHFRHGTSSSDESHRRYCTTH